MDPSFYLANVHESVSTLQRALPDGIIFMEHHQGNLDDHHGFLAGPSPANERHSSATPFPARPISPDLNVESSTAKRWHPEINALDQNIESSTAKSRQLEVNNSSESSMSKLSALTARMSEVKKRLSEMATLRKRLHSPSYESSVEEECVETVAPDHESKAWLLEVVNSRSIDENKELDGWAEIVAATHPQHWLPISTQEVEGEEPQSHVAIDGEGNDGANARPQLQTFSASSCVSIGDLEPKDYDVLKDSSTTFETPGVETRNLSVDNANSVSTSADAVYLLDGGERPLMQDDTSQSDTETSSTSDTGDAQSEGTKSGDTKHIYVGRANVQSQSSRVQQSSTSRIALKKRSALEPSSSEDEEIEISSASAACSPSKPRINPQMNSGIGNSATNDDGDSIDWV